MNLLYSHWDKRFNHEVYDQIHHKSPTRAHNTTTNEAQQKLYAHYSDIIMGAIASQITSLRIVY